MQRHADRWLYEHKAIADFCWPGQLNSSRHSSSLIADECSNVPKAGGSLRTVWQEFAERADPYSRPQHGSCQVTQGTSQGKSHAFTWGKMLKKQYIDSGLVPSGCPTGTIKLYSDKVHKNELTLETEYLALCERMPDLNEFSRESTLVGYVADPSKGTPWYAAAGQCKGKRLDALRNEAKQAMLQSKWWAEQVAPLAAEAAAVTGAALPESSQLSRLLSGLSDCVMVHACTGLGDAPKEFLDNKGLPDIHDPSALFSRMSGNVTGTWTWGFDYFAANGLVAYREYASLYYGYFFAVLSDQLRAAVRGHPKAPKLTITVMSCDNISPQLTLYGLKKEAVKWPPYLSSLIHEVYEDKTTGAFKVRVLFDGRVVRACRNADSFPLCPLEEWAATVAEFTPTPEACPALYDGYEFLDGSPVGSETGENWGSLASPPFKQTQGLNLLLCGSCTVGVAALMFGIASSVLRCRARSVQDWRSARQHLLSGFSSS
eukprot:TRINITY_DN47720_c0_g1_i1.p1 TRINITY_DN47720_c0_g1~~TRINITY_DN47720_c0_g1_i1.p1  ORF type:complete len:561 (-),score=31.89 TRINITY_DN47720_c0_g1_i1:9-1469(-)